MDILHIKETCRKVGLSRTMVFELTRTGQFPRPIALTPSGKRKGYVLAEIEGWLAQRIADRDQLTA